LHHPSKTKNKGFGKKNVMLALANQSIPLVLKLRFLLLFLSVYSNFSKAVVAFLA
jgi:hypothetical protein